MVLEVALIVVIAAASLFVAWSVIFPRDDRSRKAKLARLSRTVAHMSRHLQVLDSQSGEYFNTMHENGLNDILRIHDSLVVIVAELGDYLMHGNTQHFDALCEYASHPTTAPPRLAGLSSVELELLRDWPNRVDSVVLRLVDVLADARRKREGLGISRPMKQVPTAVALSELHKLIQSGQFDTAAE